MKTPHIAAAAMLLTLSGCAALTGGPTEDEIRRFETVKVEAQIERARADANRASVLSDMAKQGDVGAMSAAMAMMFEAQRPAQSAPQVPPWAGRKGLLDYGMQFLDIGVRWHSLDINRDIQWRLSDNATQLGIQQSQDRAATDQAAFASLQGTAGLIQAPAAPQPNITIGGNGVVGNGAISGDVIDCAASGAGSGACGGSGSANTSSATTQTANGAGSAVGGGNGSADTSQATSNVASGAGSAAGGGAGTYTDASGQVANSYNPVTGSNNPTSGSYNPVSTNY